MFDWGSQLTITESVAESADSVEESADFTTGSCPNLARISVWVWALRAFQQAPLGMFTHMTTFTWNILRS